MGEVKLENLEIDGYHLYQDKDNFNFGIDAVLLSNFVLREYFGENKNHLYHNVNKEYKNLDKSAVTNMCDLCSGTLPIPLIVYGKYKKVLSDKKYVYEDNGKNYTCDIKKLHIDSFEIDREQVALSNKSILWNKENVESAKNITTDISVYNDDIKNIILDKNKYKKMYEYYDVVTVNPPYNKKGSGLVNISDKVSSARHEISVTFDEICKVANIILKSNKKFYIIHKTSRLTEIIETLKKNSFAVKKICFIHPYIEKESNLFLIEAVKGGNAGVKILPPIVIYEKKGVYTKKVLQIYGK